MIKTSIDNERARVEDLYIGSKEANSIDNGVDSAEPTLRERAIDQLRSELSAVSELTRNLQAEIAKVKEAQSEGAKESRSPIPTPGELPQTASRSTMTWGEFHRFVGLEPPSNKEKTKTNAEVALAKAIEMGVTGWRFDSTNKNFRGHTPNPQ